MRGSARRTGCNGDPSIPSCQPHDHWLRKTEGAIKKIEKHGLSAEKVIINPDDFLAWCNSVGCKVDRKARSYFATSLLIGRWGKQYYEASLTLVAELEKIIR